MVERNHTGTVVGGIVVAMIWGLVAILALGAPPPHLAVVAKKKSAPSGGALLLDETFEGTGTVATWATGTWGDADYATLPAPLAGAQSGRMQSTGFVYHDLGQTYTELYGKLVVHADVINNGEDFHPMRLYDAAGTGNNDVAAYIRHSAGSVKQFMRWQSNHGYTSGAGTEQAAAIGSGTEDTDIYLWWHWKAETSAGAGDGIFSVWYHTSDDYANRTLVGSGTTNGGRDVVQRIAFRAGSATADWIFDSIQVSETEIQ